MDVRCEKCLTVYEFDDAQVGAAGVTVKCTQCGNLFKVKRREVTAELSLGSGTARTPAYVPPGASLRATRPGYATDHTTLPLPPVKPTESAPVQAPPPAAAAPVPPAAAPVPAPDERQWRVRLARNGEVYRFREMTTLQQWIVERKVNRDDQISRDGATWKPLGGIPELTSHFQLVEQARAKEREAEELALVTTAPMATPTPAPRARSVPNPAARSPSGPVVLDERSGPSQLDERSGPSQLGAALDDGDPAFASTAPKPRVTPPALPSVVDELAELDLPERPRRWPWVLALLMLVAGGAGGYLAWQRHLLGGGVTSGGGGQKLFDDGRAQFLRDNDEGFRQAAALFEQAHGADEQNPLPIAALAETQATWAFYLREDARALDAEGAQVAQVAQTLRKEAQAHLDEAKRHASDALALAPDDPKVNRAMGDFLRVDGAPAAEAERYLDRALQKAPNDPETVYLAGAIAYREGQEQVAQKKLEQADQLAIAAGGPALLRARYLLARIALKAGRRDDARRILQSMLTINPQHDRAKALLATLDTALDAGTSADLAPAAQAVPPAHPTAETPPGAKPAAEAVPAGDYAQLFAAGDHQSENGHTEAARKLYERALVLNPRGVEAITGLGYCDLDGERFLSAVDHFKQALAIAPDYGEALIGMAESFKMRSESDRAIEYYQRYLRVLPDGPRAEMARKNLSELKSKAKAAPPAGSAGPAGDDGQGDEPTKSPAAASDQTGGTNAPKADDQSGSTDDKGANTPLPRLPDQPAPPPP